MKKLSFSPLSYSVRPTYTYLPKLLYYLVKICFSFSCLGYFAIPVEDGIPYDSKKGVIPNIDGKVEPGLFCAGWLATGPRGVIVDTMNEAFNVGQTVAEDLMTSSSEAQ